MEKEKTVGRARITSLFDAGTFVETGSFIKRADGGLTGVICGYGAVMGKLVFAFAQDSDRKLGAFDAYQAEKIEKLYELALRNGAPVVGMFDSAGASVLDGATAMAAYGKLLAVVSRASGVIPQIALVPGICAGTAATVASMFDFIITVKGKTSLSVGAPFLLGKEVGNAEYASETGLASILSETEADAFAAAKKLLALLPADNEEGAIARECADDVNRATNAESGSVASVLQNAPDAGSYLELGAGYQTGMITGFAAFGGVTCGIVANDPTVSGGAITADGAKKAAKLISFCDAFSIPVVTFVDSTGVECSRDAEQKPLAAELGKLAMTYATAETAKITVVTGKAYGAAFTLMGSRALGADLSYALPDAEISVMAPDAAVAFLWNDQISETVTRESLVEKWKTECAAPASAAADGSIDDVIPAAELRQRICAAVYMLLCKRDGDGCRRHCNLPL